MRPVLSPLPRAEGPTSTIRKARFLLPFQGVEVMGGGSNPPLQEAVMLGWALTFLILAVIAAVLGFTGIAGAAANIAQILFFVFLVLLIISFLARAIRGHPPT